MANQSRTSLRVAYDGPALADGRMDVRDLAPALVAISELCDESFRLLNGEGQRVRVEVQADFRGGSFAVGLEVVGFWNQFVDMFSGRDASAVSNLLQILGFLGVPSAIGLLQLVRILKGKRPETVIRLESSTVRIALGDESITIREDVLKLYADLKVRNALSEVIAPLGKDGIDVFETRDEHNAPVVRVTKDEVSFFAPPAILEEDEEVLIDRTEERAFEVVGLTFKDDNKWRLSDGEAIVYAAIEDKEFLRRINDHDESFLKGDVLVCLVRFRQIRTSAGVRNEYTVLRVLEHKHAPRQQVLKLPDED